jgi:hypothetical protein
MNDQPMAGAAFKLTGGGKAINRSTNKSGFGNFSVSALNRNEDVVNRGEYEFLALIPPGWLLTTNNASQQTFFEIMPGAPGDMISSTPIQPVGLAQELSIRGRLASSTVGTLAHTPAPGSANQIRARAVSPAGKEQEIVADQSGLFTFAAAPGTWTITAEDMAGRRSGERKVEVSASPVWVAALVPGEDRRGDAGRSTSISFDDLVSSGIKEIPSGYHGLNWANWVATHQKFYDGEGYPNTTMSGEFVAYNSSGHPVSISRERPFDFVGGYFGSAWLRAEGETLRVKGWRRGTLAYDDTIKLSALGPVYFAASFQGITRLEFATGRYWQFVCDDLDFLLSD